MLKKIILGIITLILACILYVWGVYNGYWQLNHPSRSQYPIRGIDVSHYQGEIDWEILSGEDIAFVYIKATEGSSHVDRKFSYNFEEAGQTPLAVGAYHFFSFDSPGDTQAENFIKNVEKKEGMLPPVVDVEYYADKKVNQPDVDTVHRELKSFLAVVEAHYEMTPVIYATEEVWQKYISGCFDENPLWIRSVITKPNQSADWTFWQYSNRSRLKGYTGGEEYIDMNVYYGSEAEWNLWKNN